MAWVSRQVEHNSRLRKTTCTVTDVVEEFYLRMDIPCGAPSCQTLNPDVCQPTSQTLPPAAQHFLIPDAHVLRDLIDVFELPDFDGYILLRSVLKKVQKLGNVRLNARIRQLTTELWRNIAVFDNLHCLYTAVTQQDRCSGEDVLKAAQYYVDHLGNDSEIIVLKQGHHRGSPHPAQDQKSSPNLTLEKGTDAVSDESDEEGDDALDQLLGLSLEDEMPRKPTAKQPVKDSSQSKPQSTRGFRVLSPEQYFAQYWQSHERVQELAQALKASQLVGTPKRHARTKTLYPPHLTASAAQSGLDAGVLFKGKLQVSTRRRGEAFVKVAGHEDIFLPNITAINRALHGDSVAVRLVKTEVSTLDSLADTPAGDDSLEAVDSDDEGVSPRTPPPRLNHATDVGSQETRDAAVSAPDSGPGVSNRGTTSRICGQVESILSAATRDIVACIDEMDENTVTESGKMESCLCVPLDSRMPKLRLRSSNLGRLVGQRFVVRVDAWEATSRYPACHLLRVLGPLKDLRSSTEAILASSGIEQRAFSRGAIEELPAIDDPRRWTVPDEELECRRDLRGPEYHICSIDPPGCTDVDDCLSVRHLDGGCMEVGVHIADVSYFVRQGSSLDAEGSARGTTVYLVDRRLDMLPSLLSEHLCSLREGQDRLAVSVLWTLNPSMEVLDTWFGRTIIRSRHQLAYKQAQDILDGNDTPLARQVSESDRQVLSIQLQGLKAVADWRRGKRQKAGALELESAELSFETSAEGQSVILNKEVVPMMAVVAEMMIWANESVAEKLVSSFPTAALVRTHAPPPLSAFEEIAEICKATGASPDVTSPNSFSAALEAAVRAAADAATVNLIKGLATRAMQEAAYISTGGRLPANGMGHFGLGLHHYTHFTSPIRRYADIVVHRQLLASLEAASQPPLRHSQLALAADLMNERTRQAKVAQRECSNLFTLNSLEKQPQMEHALVYEVHPTTLQLFLPKFGMRAKVFLLDKHGRVKAPIDDPSSAKQMPQEESFSDEYSLETGGDTLRITSTKSGKVEVLARRMQKLWVLMTCKQSRNHGGQLQVALIKQGNASATATPGAGMTRRQLIDKAAADLRSESKEAVCVKDAGSLMQQNTLLDQFKSGHTKTLKTKMTSPSMASVIQDTLKSFVEPSSQPPSPSETALMVHQAGSPELHEEAGRQGPPTTSGREESGDFGDYADSPTSAKMGLGMNSAVVSGEKPFQSGCPVHALCNLLHLVGYLKAKAMRRHDHKLSSHRQKVLDDARQKLAQWSHM